MKACVALLLACLPVALWGQHKNSVSLGILGEVNTYTRDTSAQDGKFHIPLMGGALADFGFTDHIAAGLRASYGTEFYDVSVVEAMAFGRFYFINTPFKKPIFIQLGGGLAILMEDDRRVPAPLGDIAIGIRFPIKKFYIEPYLRGGWPTGMGLGIVVGYRFDIKTREKPKPQINVPFIPNIIFRANNADFVGKNQDSRRGLDEQTIENNMAAIREIADFLKVNPAYTVLIEGYANPVEGTQREDETLLIPLSRARAEFVKNELIQLGIEDSRITTAALGGNAAVKFSQENRRVRIQFQPPEGTAK